jgi:hypothetical protein
VRKLFDFINYLIIIYCFIVALLLFDPVAAAGCVLLVIANLNKRCSSLYFLLFYFNLHFTMRYILVRYYQFDCLFDDMNPETFGYYFLLSSLMYLLIAIAINSSVLHNRVENAVTNKALGVISAISIILFSITSFSGVYSIGREIQDPISRLVVRASLFLQYWLPAIFFLNSWWIYLIIYAAAMLIFGSKGFVYIILILAIYFGIINNLKVNYVYVTLFFVTTVVSILLFDVILAYRTSRVFDFGLLQKSSIFNESSYDIIRFFLNKIGSRWGGLDVLVAYGQTDYKFSLLNIYYEIIIGINNLLPVIKLPLPDNYIRSELMTASLFRGYDFLSVATGDIRHTDSMFGLPRFIAVDYGFGLILFMMCLVFPFIIRFKNYFMDSLVKIYFFSSVIIGGSYAETFRLFFELCLIYFILRMRFVKSALEKVGRAAT